MRFSFQKKTFFKIFLLFLSWRIILFLVGSVADSFMVYAPSFAYPYKVLAGFGLPREVFSWGNFDGVHYLTIAYQGYTQNALIQAFFPMYPMLMNFLMNFGIMSFWAGLVVSNAMALIMLVLFFKLVESYKDKQTAWWSIVALLIFPTSFFFGAIYSESLFMSLVFGALLLIKNKKWFWAGLVAGIASGTRIVGATLFPLLLIEWLYPNYTKFSKQIFINAWKKIKKTPKKLIFSLLSLWGLITYMTYLKLNFNDYLYFLHVQSEFGAGREESLVLLPQVIWRYLKILITARPIDWKYYSYVQELALSLGSLSALVIFWKKIRPSWLVFSLLVWFIPTLTGTFLSMPRLILPCFPLFILWGSWLKSAKPIWRYLTLTISGILLIINILLFIQGYWVA